MSSNTIRISLFGRQHHRHHHRILIHNHDRSIMSMHSRRCFHHHMVQPHHHHPSSLWPWNFHSTTTNNIQSSSWMTNSCTSRTATSLYDNNSNHKNDSFIQQRKLSSSSSNDDSVNIPYSSKYEYPLATEPPIITRTKASDYQKYSKGMEGGYDPIYEKVKKRQQEQNKQQPMSDPNSVMDVIQQEDPFDDMNRLKENERKDILQGQKLYINTKPPGTTPITIQMPSYIPHTDNYEEQISAHKQLLYNIPKIQSTTLENGIRIVSQNVMGSQVSAVGVVCELGSRTERANLNQGVCNVLEMLTFNSNTKQYTGQQITQLLLDLGGTRFGNIGREQSLFCIDILRHNVPYAISLFEQVLNQYQYTNYEIEEILNTLQYSYENLPPDLLLSEAIQTAAYGPDQQLGQHHYNTNIESLFTNINVNTCNQYWEQQFTNNPKGIVIGGIGIDHGYLVELIHTSTSFPSFQQNDKNRTLIKPSVYRGGEYRYQLPEPIALDGESNNNSLSMPVSITMEEQNMVKVAVAFEVCGWHHHIKHANNDAIKNDLVTVCVLQTLLGGGSSFSAGGPGKGMYSRLYRQILNRYHWVESCEAFTTFYNESGLFGIVGTTLPSHIDDMTHVIVGHLLRLTTELVSDEELNRAKNMLKNNVLTQLESRLVLFEDISRQVLTYGQREDIQQTIQKIQNVTAHDIQSLCQRMIANNSKKPTIACIGKDISNVPKLETIQKWFS